MKLKLDENLGRQVWELLRDHGHDVQTVPDERLSAIADEDLIQACRTERRCLVTLDLEFGNPLLFTPTEYAGIAVLRLPRKRSPDDLLETVETLISALSREDPAGKLWIVQKGRIRVYQDPRTD
jgi:predicted nuclease of predicted toxin-antitoxin system